MRLLEDLRVSSFKSLSHTLPNLRSSSTVKKIRLSPPSKTVKRTLVFLFSLLLSCLVLSHSGILLRTVEEQVQPDITLAPDRLPSDEKTAEEADKILILTSMRSGSSVLGELVAKGSSRPALYLYEPLHILQTTHYEENFVQASLDVLDSLYAQDLQSARSYAKTDYKRSWFDEEVVKFRGSGQDHPGPVVIKTLRLKTGDPRVIRWIRKGTFKVIHLVRDPRGMMSSISHLNDFQKPCIQICRKIIEDSAALQGIPAQRLLRLRYEDLVQDPLEVLSRTFEFLGFPTDVERVKNIMEKYFVPPSVELNNAILNDPFGIQRSSSQLDPKAWRKSLSQERLDRVESLWECRAVIHLYGYDQPALQVYHKNDKNCYY